MLDASDFDKFGSYNGTRKNEDGQGWKQHHLYAMGILPAPTR